MDNLYFVARFWSVCAILRVFGPVATMQEDRLDPTRRQGLEEDPAEDRASQASCDSGVW